MIGVSDAVHEALALGRPIVGLESTLIAHGLPWPVNLETALAMEAAVRAAGALPATIGIIAGRPIIGLSPEQIELLATSPSVVKASRRDLALVVARGEHGATTVAGTLALMGRAGLAVLATGGIGGVHRRAERTFDISADLAELARISGLVVCSGPKLVLDLPRTAELLETLGVTVLGLATDELPAFYARSSGLSITRVEHTADAAAVVRARSELQLDGAVLLTVPPPPETALETGESAELGATLAEADAAGVRGGEVTPFLLERMAALTAGRSLVANRALLVNNARVAAEAAVALTRLSQV